MPDGLLIFEAEIRLLKILRLFHTFVLKVMSDVTCFKAMQMHSVLDFLLPFLKYYSQTLEIRAQVADAFLSKFQLTSDEMSLLRGTREGPITEVFCLLLKSLKA